MKDLQSFPDSTISSQAMEFIGYTTKTASQIYTDWCNRSGMREDDLLSYAIGWNSQLSLPFYQDLSKEAAMIRLGLVPETIEAILAPNFPGLCDSQDLLERVNDTTRLNWYTMLQLERRIKLAAGIAVAKKRAKRAKVEVPAGNEAASSSTAPATTDTAEVIGATLSASSSHNLIRTMVVGPAPIPLPNHTILYKGKSPAELVEPENEPLQPDGSLNMEHLFLFPGGDFNPRRVYGQYWTPDRDAAEMYRQEAAARAKFSESWLISIQVPNDFLQQIQVQELWWSQNFKNYVWYCRRKDINDTLPTSLIPINAAACLKGHVLYQASPVIAKIKQENLRVQFKEDWLMVLNGRKIEQFCFKGDETVLELAQQCKGKVHIEVHEAVQDIKNSI